ncbi:MAG: hypothetical protein K0Q72_4312 [Armatimonadetes bacterium]|jgi:hypothetical protein|nr:hypothetical protein [Armatimonadota bacterium]
MSSKECRRTREAWGESFDHDTTPPAGVEAHLARCGECAAFARASTQARSTLRAAALPAADPAADFRLLEALQSAPQAPAPNPLAAWLAAMLSPGVPRLAAAGFATFLATLGVAYGLTAAASGPVGEAPAGVGGAAPSRGYLVNQIQLWVGPEPAVLALPEPSRPRPPKGRVPAGDDAQPDGGRAGGTGPELPVG